MRRKYSRYAGTNTFIISMADPAVAPTGWAWCADCDDMEQCECKTLRYIPLGYHQSRQDCPNTYRVPRTSIVVIK